MSDIKVNNPALQTQLAQQAQQLHQAQKAGEAQPGDRFANGTKDQSKSSFGDVKGGNKNPSGGERERGSASMMFRQNAFEAEMNRYQQDDQSGGQKGRREGGEETFVVLAALDGGKPGAALNTPAVDKAHAPAPTQQIEDIAKQVAAKVDAALRPGPMIQSGPQTFNLVFDAKATGFHGISVTVNGGEIVVMLQKSAEFGPENLQQAAMNLAQILQSRFPKKAIQVVEATKENETAAVEGGSGVESGERPSGMSAFSSLFEDRNRGA
ncbi:MAG: hypothetical protein AAGE61_22810 [Pseudomonadota bacterium]